MSSDLQPQSEVQKRYSMNYPEALLRIWKLCDKESVRYALGFVRVDFANQDAEATNGRIVARENIECEFDDEFATHSPVLFYRDDLKRIALIFDKEYKRHDLKLVNEGSNWYAESDLIRLRIQTEDSRFPDTSSVFDVKPTQVAKFTLNMVICGSSSLLRIC